MQFLHNISGKLSIHTLSASCVACVIFCGIFLYTTQTYAQAGGDTWTTTLTITNPYECTLDLETGSILTYSGAYYTKYSTLFFSLYSEEATEYLVTGNINPTLTGTLEALETLNTQATLVTGDGVKYVSALFTEGPISCVGDTFSVYLDTTGPTPPDPVIPLVIRLPDWSPDIVHFIWIASTDAGIGLDSYTFLLADNDAFINAYQVNTTNNYQQVPVATFTHTGRWFWQVFAYDKLENMTPGVAWAFTYDLSGSTSTWTTTTWTTTIWGGNWTGTTTWTTIPPGISITTLIPWYLYCSGTNLYATTVTWYWGWGDGSGGTETENIDTHDVQESDLPDDLPIEDAFPWWGQVPQAPGTTPPPQTIGVPITKVRPLIPSKSDWKAPVCIRSPNGKWSCQPVSQPTSVGKFIPFGGFRKVIPPQPVPTYIPDEEFIVQTKHWAAPIKILKVPASILPRLLKRMGVPIGIQILILIMSTQYVTYNYFDLETLRRWYRLRRNRKQDPHLDIVWMDNEWFVVYYR